MVLYGAGQRIRVESHQNPKPNGSSAWGAFPDVHERRRTVPEWDQTGCTASRRCEAIHRSRGSPDSNEVINAYRGFGPGLCTT